MAVSAVFSTSALAQNGVQKASASAPTSTTIVAPINIVNDGELNFGSFASGIAGTLKITSAGVRSATGGVKTNSIVGTVTPASFKVTGESGYTYSITLPIEDTEDLILTDAVSSTTVTVTKFESSVAVGAGQLSVSELGGEETFTVGATLEVGANQVAGTYKSTAGFQVTVNYN